MTEQKELPADAGFSKAKDLIVRVHFEKDPSREGIQRAHQVKKIMCEMILLGMKRGRPAEPKEIENEAA